MGANFTAWVTRHVHAHPMRVAIGYMLLSAAGFSLMNLCVRFAAQTLPAPLIVNLRNLLTLTLLLPFVARNRFAIVRTRRLKDHVLRSAIGAIGMLAWTYSLTRMPLVHATALSFTAPLIATLLAVVILKERAGRRQVIGLVLGSFGTLVILRPAAAGFDWTALFVLLATTSWAVTSLFIKSLSRTEPPIRMVFYMNLFMFLLGLPLGITHWQVPACAESVALLGMCCASIFMHVTLARAYALAPVSALMPVDFMRLVYTALFAHLLFGETIDGLTWIGAAIVIASAAYAAPRRLREEATVE